MRLGQRSIQNLQSKDSDEGFSLAPVAKGLADPGSMLLAGPVSRDLVERVRIVLDQAHQRRVQLYHLGRDADRPLLVELRGLAQRAP